MTVTANALDRAAEIVRAAYEEALRRHSLLPSTIELIHTYAEENLSALNESNEPNDSP